MSQPEDLFTLLLSSLVVGARESWKAREDVRVLGQDELAARILTAMLDLGRYLQPEYVDTYLECVQEVLEIPKDKFKIIRQDPRWN